MPPPGPPPASPQGSKRKGMFKKVLPWALVVVFAIAALSQCGEEETSASPSSTAPSSEPVIEEVISEPEPTEESSALTPAEKAEVREAAGEVLDEGFVDHIHETIPTFASMTNEDLIKARNGVCTAFAMGQTPGDVFQKYVAPISDPTERNAMSSFVGTSVGWHCSEFEDSVRDWAENATRYAG